MKIFADRKIKRLFCRVMSAVLAFAAATAACAVMGARHAALYALMAAGVMGACIFAAMYLYFQEQNRMLEDAAAQIRGFLSGDRSARIECSEEGELYRLFHEVNMLASVLNAHAENESRAKGFLKDTISDISHQLKTPLAALNIYNGLLQEEAGDMPAVLEFAALSERELDRIEALVQSLLKITKIDAGTIVIEKRAENIAEQMEDIERQFAYRAEQEGKTLALSGDGGVTLLCDPNWLKEAVGNVVKNALDHTEEGDVIRIEWREAASMVQIIVSDSGSGIHPEDLPHIFKRFYRSRFSKDRQGLGLGLPMAKAIVEAHNGTIEVNSELGRGTVFTMNFLNPTKL